jgi:hypothetical protein
MFPSPSDGPPRLSASASPAFGPWGIPLELAAVEDVAAPPDELEDCVEEVAAGAEELEELLDEFDPQAATPSAARTSSTAAGRRIRRAGEADMTAGRGCVSSGLVVVVIFTPWVDCRGETPALT